MSTPASAQGKGVSPIQPVATVSGHPTYTIGWDVLKWISTNLIQPDGDNAGEPFVLTAEQARFVLWLYAVDETGRFLHRRAVLQRPKGWG